MSPGRQPAEHEFSTDLRQRKAFERAIESCDEHQPVGLYQASASRQESPEVGDMLDDFHVEDEVELDAFADKSLGRRSPVSEIELGTGGMSFRRSHVFLRSVGAQHGESHPRRRLVEKPAAPADVEEAQPFEGTQPVPVPLEVPRGEVADEFKPDRIERVQRAEFSGRVPPFGGQPIEFLDFLGIDGALVFALGPAGRSERQRGGCGHESCIRPLSEAQAASMYGPQSPPTPEPEMSKIVMKFGGTSVADIDRIRNVARLVKRETDAQHQVAVVVSAMSGETNKLVAWTRALSPLHDAREYDTVVAAGEQITAGLLAVALSAIGVPARSWLGWQVPIRTSAMHGSARIVSIEPGALNERLQQGQVAVVAGFQGIAPDNRVSTLGRGGSDTSAVALAAALKADRCDIYTDVDGVYTSDPRVVHRGQRLHKIAFEEMLELASLGAKVLQTRSVELAMLHRVPVRVLSTFDADNGGNLLFDEEDIVGKNPVNGIAYSRDETTITLL